MMLRHSLVVIVGLCLTVPATAATWADGMFDELSKDFGSVPRGPTLTHPFRLVNNTGRVVVIGNVRVSCGCTSAAALKNRLAPGEETAILAQMDTNRFLGPKTVTIFVRLDEPQSEEVRLWVQANSRDDVSVTPDTLAFGQVKRGTTPSVTSKITFLGFAQAQVSGVTCESNYVQTSLKEVRRQDTEVSYELTAKLRADAPVGKWFTDVWLQTNNPSMPKVRVPLTIEIEAPLTVFPGVVALGQVRAGSQAERRVVVRGIKPFQITAIEGTDDLLQVQDSTKDSKAVHVLTVTLKGGKVGEVSRTIKIVTDFSEEKTIEFQAKGEVMGEPVNSKK